MGAGKIIEGLIKALGDDAAAAAAKAAPGKTAKAYKLFRQKDGKLYPLFVDANEEVPLGEWLKAKAGEQTSSGKVKSKLGELAYRPGWHAGDLPVATHIGARSHGDPKLPPDTRPSSQVWAEIEMADDVDWQSVANERARITKKGKPDPKTAHITDQVPYGGFYRYKTNPNMTGNWLIGGDMKVNRLLTDEEVKAINDAAGVADLPRREGYAGGGLIKKLVGAVAREAPELSRGAAQGGRRAIVNIGLDIPGGGRLTPEEALAAVQRFGVKPVRSMVAQSDTEPTLVLELDRALAADEAHELSAMLQQEAIAQVDETGAGDLFGPGADEWKPFNGDYFIAPSGRRLTDEIMAAGNPEAVPGGVEPDPVLDKLNEIADSLEPQKYAGGGIIKEAVEAAPDMAKKLMRLYHGTTKLPGDPKSVLSKAERDGSRGFDYLDPNRRNNQLGLHLGNQKQADYFASDKQHLDAADIELNKNYWASETPEGGRIIPLDVELNNPVRLEDRTGTWWPDEIYQQLVAQGKVADDKELLATLKRMQHSTDDNERLAAMQTVRQLIEDAGHDGAVYTNRIEGFTTDDPVRQRFKRRGIEDWEADDKTWLEVVPEAQGNDSYIVWDKKKYRSPFGDGSGVGFEDGGPVRMAGGGLMNKIGAGLIDMLDFSTVGKPRSVKIPDRGEVAALPIKELDAAAEAYMKKHGIPGTHRIDAYPEFDEEFARRIADEYDRAKHAPGDPKVRKAYDALIDETLAQYKALEDSGIDVRFLKDGMADPYAKSPSMGYADIVDNGRLWVFPTEQGYGSLDDIGDNPLLKKVGRVGDKADAVANDAFRVVHDAYGHFGPGNPFFRHKGEDRAWQHHGRMFTDDALPAMTAETRGQNSWLNFGPYGEKNRAALGADTIFADQKATIMPPWVYERDLGRTPRFADGGPVWSEEDVASMTHEESYGTGRRPAYLETMGQKIPIGETNYYVNEDGTEYAPGEEGPQLAHDLARLGIYAVPFGGAALGAALDTTEAIATDDPLSAGMAVAFGPGGKKVKAALTGALAYGMDPADAEAGVFGKVAKWGASKEGVDLLGKAENMLKQGATNEEVRAATNWFLDTDGHWKYWLPSKGGSADISKSKGRLGDVYYDPFVYDQYPGLEGMTFRRKNAEGAHFDPDNDEIVLGDISRPVYHSPENGGLWGILGHEVYHKKSATEGWPQGTSVLGAADKIGQDMKRFLSSRQGTPDFNVGKELYSLATGSDKAKLGTLAFNRYEAEAGEALARREQLMREMPEELLKGFTPNDQRYIDIPTNVMFHPNIPATAQNYRDLMKYIEDKAAAADMMAAKGDVVFTNTPPAKGKKK